MSTTRDQYISHKLYLEKRAGNRYYNLGYMMYKEIINGTSPAINTNLKVAITNFEVALLFDKNDVNSTMLKNELCDKYGTNGSLTQVMSADLMTTWKNNAKTIYRNCKGC
jgi:hypothetical protein